MSLDESNNKPEQKIVKLNVGGKIFITLKQTLTMYPESMLCAMFSGKYESQFDDNGYHFIDRSPELFYYVLEFLRTRKIAKCMLTEKESNPEFEQKLNQELKYFNLPTKCKEEDFFEMIAVRHHIDIYLYEYGQEKYNPYILKQYQPLTQILVCAEFKIDGIDQKDKYIRCNEWRLFISPKDLVSIDEYFSTDDFQKLNITSDLYLLQHPKDLQYSFVCQCKIIGIVCNNQLLVSIKTKKYLVQLKIGMFLFACYKKEDPLFQKLTVSKMSQ